MLNYDFIGFYVDVVNLWPTYFFLSFAENTSKEPAFYSGHFFIEKSSQVKDTFISFNNLGKGIAFINDFNLGRYWPVKYYFVPLEWILVVIIYIAEFNTQFSIS